MSAMQACGLAGYRNDGEFSIGRHLRDMLSSPIMISNDRILANLGHAAVLTGRRVRYVIERLAGNCLNFGGAPL